MKRIAIVCAALLCAAVSSSAARLTEEKGEGLYGISAGKVSMVIDAGKGAKILSFKYEDQEIISQIQRFNAFGATFWTSPQSEWNWPPVAEYDRLEYQVEQTPTSLVMEGKTSERFGYSIRKKFEADPSDGSIVVTYSIVNRSDQTRKVAPWEITRVPGEGLIFFAAKSSDITPAGLMEFNDKYGAAWSSFSGQTTALAVVTVLLMGAVAYLLVRRIVRHPLGVIAGLMILAGGVGNLIDRLFRGYVVDMFDLTLFSYPVFNFADCCVVVGAILGAVYYLFLYDKYDKKDKKHGNDPADGDN